MEDELGLLLRYPLLTKTSEGNAEVFKGPIHINDEDFEVYIRESYNADFEVILPEKLRHLSPEFDTVMTKLCPKTITSILDSLAAFIKTKLPCEMPPNYCDVYRHVLYEYSDFSNFYLNLKSCRLAYDLSEVSASVLDQAGRLHAVKISVSFDDKNMFGVSSYDLPLDEDAFRQSSSLKDVYDQFLGAVEASQPFLDVMATLDENCWVLDPVRPERRCRHRRIWISDNFSVVITLDPTDVAKLPEIKFLGPEKSVEGYRDTLNANIAGWEPQNGVFSETLKLLGLETFPSRPVVEERGPDLLMETGDCSICFSLRLNDRLPEVVCKNKFCEKCYHAECLYEWLVSVNARRFFSEVVGLCPNCEKNIACPVPK